MSCHNTYKFLGINEGSAGCCTKLRYSLSIYDISTAFFHIHCTYKESSPASLSAEVQSLWGRDTISWIVLLTVLSLSLISLAFFSPMAFCGWQ